jgi:hypothetical protein
MKWKTRIGFWNVRRTIQEEIILEDHGMRSRGQMEMAMLGSSSWMPYAPQGVKGTDDDDDKQFW